MSSNADNTDCDNLDLPAVDQANDGGAKDSSAEVEAVPDHHRDWNH
jgi:hypothetical protein